MTAEVEASLETSSRPILAALRPPALPSRPQRNTACFTYKPLLVIQYPEIADNDGLPGLPPQAWVADQLAAGMRDLQRVLLRYREAVTDDARHPARRPITQMPLPYHPR